MLRDPVLLVPAVVGAGFAVGWLGADAGASGTRVATDIALAWALVAASLVALERARWRRARVLLAAAAFALLAADLQLGELARLVDARLPARRAVGSAPRPGRVDVSRGASLGRVPAGSRSRARTRQRSAVSSSGPSCVPDSRDVLSVAPQQAVSDAVDRAQEILGIAVGAGRGLPDHEAFARSGRARTTRAGATAGCGRPDRSRGCALAGLGERDRRERSDASRRSVGQFRCSSRSGSSEESSGRGYLDERRPTSSSSCERRGRPASASDSPGSSVTRRSMSRIASTTAATSTPPAIRSSSRRARIGRSRW